jgi:hypothetical protein
MAYYTVVYQVADEAAFKPEWNRIHELFRQEPGAPFRITAISHDHEMRRVSLIEDAAERYDLEPERFMDVVGEILGSCDVIALEQGGPLLALPPPANRPKEVSDER